MDRGRGENQNCWESWWRAYRRLTSLLTVFIDFSPYLSSVRGVNICSALLEIKINKGVRLGYWRYCYFDSFQRLTESRGK